MVDVAALTRLIEPEVKSLGFSLVRVAMIGGTTDPTLQVMAERPETRQLELGDCETISRRLSEIFDALEAEGRDPIESAYRLEVSSPGIDRPLTRAKDFAQWAGHEVRILLANPVEGNRKSLQGELVGIEGDTITLDDKKSGRVGFTLADIQSAKLVLTDRLIAATRPLDTSGADEEVFGSEDEPGEILEVEED